MVKKILVQILLISFVFQIGHSMALGKVMQKIIYEISSFCNDDCELSFFDFEFKDLMCETQENDEQTEKSLGTDLYFKNDYAYSLTSEFKVEQKLYLTLSAFFASGFYLSLIQPPD
jgi:hypothetical protein